MTHIMIMAGGTGGHVFPGLAVARSLQKAQHRVSWLGTRAGIESRLVPANEIPLSYIDITGVRGKGVSGLLAAPFRIVHAVMQALMILRKAKPDCVLGMGGFAAGPGGLAARLLGIPLVVHEQNAVPGTTNKILSHISRQVLQAFPGAFPGKANAQTVGNPVRDDLSLKQYQADDDRPLHILVIGGSLGALAINELMPQVNNALKTEVLIYHQSGEKHLPALEEAYRQAGNVTIRAFIDDMAAAYQWADLVICRAGAMTVSEVAAVGLPAIFIPFPYAIDDHQTANACWLADKGAAIVMQQRDITVEKMTETIETLASDRKKLAAMAEKAAAAGIRDAAEKVAAICLEVAR